jgi:hypothetical protein
MKKCFSESSIHRDFITMFNEMMGITFFLKKEKKLNIYSCHIHFKRGEHLHAWIHTHHPSETERVPKTTHRNEPITTKKGKQIFDKLKTPLRDDDPLVLLGADKNYGTLLNNALIPGSREGGCDSNPYSSDSISKPIKLFDISDDFWDKFLSFDEAFIFVFPETQHLQISLDAKFCSKEQLDNLFHKQTL